MKGVSLLVALVQLWCLCALLLMTEARHCIHDDLGKTPRAYPVYVNYTNHHKRAERQPMRFHTVFDDSNSTLNAEQREYIRRIMPIATGYISGILKVTPAASKIGAQPFCTSFYTVSKNCASIDTDPVSCGGTLVPKDLIIPVTVCPDSPSVCKNQPADAGEGVAADFLLFVNSKAGKCRPTTLAFASFCQQDQLDRPIVGFITVCPSLFPKNWTKATSTPTFLAATLSTLIHEMMHTLGFSSVLFNYFRDENGNPRVPRDPKNGMPLEDSAGAVRAKSTFRGHTVTKIVTPTVVSVARELTGCPTLDGAELEDAGGAGHAGSHWEERQWWGEFMNAEDSAIRFSYSKLTLALMKDSGWYDVDLNAGQTIPWSSQVGCESLSSNCINDKVPLNTVNKWNRWCTSPGQEMCTPDRLSTAVCSKSTHYQYFTDNEPDKGSDTQDYCPTLSTSYDPALGWDCLSAVTEEPSDFDFSQKSLTSRCIMGDLTGPGYIYKGILSARCYPVACVRDARGVPTSVVIKLGTHNITCTKEGDAMTAAGTQGSIICPPLNSVCPYNADCPNSCYGFGTCEKEGKCNCWAGFSGGDCSLMHM